MKKTTWWALPIAATLAVTGCGGGAAPEEAAKPGQTAGAEALPSSPAPSNEPGATDQPSVSPATPSSSASAETTQGSQDSKATAGRQFTAKELGNVAKAIRQAGGPDGTKVLEDAELRASMPTIEQILAGMKVKPAECGSFAVAGASEMMDRVTMAAVVFPPDADDLSTSVNLGSYDSADVIDQALAQADQGSTRCSEFTLSMQGQEVSAVVEPAKADTSATTTLATVTNVEMMGQNMQTLTVTGYKGHSNVSVNISNPTNLSKAVKEAEKYIDLALLQMEGK
ncbi:hypothetical protein [Paeniglutamicibacter psychrophenolicus]|uniref:hypothetical protein n=1 Tax=Paeniglutamicibacter psychrophenolicus TaxID=257454 RepID=UPI00277D496E|nr:hypothetical protein [Paeniglutamicibacter psychrophenolicus]MDQ0094824.1 hypothetical protein [Paeniglutamicibacter psychrophenolicus]